MDFFILVLDRDSGVIHWMLRSMNNAKNDIPSGQQDMRAFHLIKSPPFSCHPFDGWLEHDQVTPRFLGSTMIKSPPEGWLDHAQVTPLWWVAKWIFTMEADRGGGWLDHGQGVTWSFKSDSSHPLSKGGDMKKGVTWSSTVHLVRLVRFLDPQVVPREQKLPL